VLMRILSRVFAIRSDETVGWFTKAIQPSVARWKMKLIEAQIRPDEKAGPDNVAQYRQALLADFKRRVMNENGKPYSDYAVFKAKQHSMHKSESFKWRSGALPVDNPATESFERFLKDNQHPVPRKTKE
jgi:hypothetical protein